MKNSSEKNENTKEDYQENQNQKIKSFRKSVTTSKLLTSQLTSVKTGSKQEQNNSRFSKNDDEETQQQLNNNHKNTQILKPLLEEAEFTESSFMDKNAQQFFHNQQNQQLFNVEEEEEKEVAGIQMFQLENPRLLTQVHFSLQQKRRMTSN